MTVETRFDEAIIQQAKTHIDELTKHKEIRSVAIILDWDMPVTTGLPTGLWQHRTDADPLMCSIQMSAQLGRAVTNQQHTTMKIINMVVAQQKDQSNDIPAEKRV